MPLDDKSQIRFWFRQNESAWRKTVRIIDIENAVAAEIAL